MTTSYTDHGQDRSGDNVYRYMLWRQWTSDNVFKKTSGTTVFIMLNPSTADGDIDDPTIRRCVGFTRSWGHNRLEVVNLFAYRATDPKELLKVSNPVGLKNDEYILGAVSRADVAVCAWGAMGWIDDRAKAVRALLKDQKLHSLGLTRGAHPKHPLYLHALSKLEVFR